MTPSRLSACALALTAGLAAAPATAPAASATAPADPSAAIARMRSGLIDAFQHGDVDRLLSYLTPDVVVTWQNGTVCHGPAEVRAFYDKMMSGDPHVVAKVTSDPQVDARQVNGDWAVSVGHMNDRFELTDGSDLPFDSRFTAVTVRRGDRWFVQAFHVSANAFDNPVVHMAARKGGTSAGLAGGAGGLIVGATAGAVFARRRRPTA